MIKEHLSILSLDQTVVDKMTAIPTGTKASFTRKYNLSHQAITKKVGGKAGVKNKKSAKDSDESSSDEESDGENVLIDEEEMKEIKAAKK